MLLYSLYCCKIIIIIIIVIVIVIIIYQNLNHLSIKKKKVIIIIIIICFYMVNSLLCPMVYLARTELKMFWREGTVYISEFKLLLLHTLLEWSSFINLFPCSNFLEMLDLCNLCVWCTVIHVHPRCTWTFD